MHDTAHETLAFQLSPHTQAPMQNHILPPPHTLSQTGRHVHTSHGGAAQAEGAAGVLVGGEELQVPPLGGRQGVVGRVGDLLGWSRGWWMDGEGGKGCVAGWGRAMIVPRSRPPGSRKGRCLDAVDMCKRRGLGKAGHPHPHSHTNIRIYSRVLCYPSPPMLQALVPPSPTAVSATLFPTRRREEQGPMAPATLNSREVSTCVVDLGRGDWS